MAITSIKAQDNDHFFRGQNPTKYDFLYNGNPYWESAEFKTADVFFDGKLYKSQKVNINSYRNTLILQRPESLIPTELEVDKISWLQIKDTLFINLRYNGIESANKGFYQVLTTTNDILLKQVVKKLNHNGHDANGKIIGYYDPNYNSKLMTCFEQETNLFVLKNGSLIKISDRKTFLALYEGREKELRSKGRIYPRPSLEKWCKLLLEYMQPCNADVLRRFQKDPFLNRNLKDAAQIVIEQPNISRTLELPEGWFLSEDAKPGIVAYKAGETITAVYQNKVYVIGDKTRYETKTNKHKVHLQGYVFDSSNNEPLAGVIIYDTNTQTYAFTDKNGRYQIDLPAGPNTLNLSAQTMEDFHAMVELYDNARFNVEMNREAIMLESAMISADSRASHRTARMGLDKMSSRAIHKMPAAFGEPDVMKAVQSLPGVKSVGEASGGINVRGGSSDQNLILYNGSTIYNPSHMFGLFSTFNPELVDGLELYKSTYPVEYGGRLSAVLDVKGKEGRTDRFGGALGIGLLTSNGYIEGPISKRTNIILGGRTTYSDYLLGMLPKTSEYSNASASFNDLNLGVTHRFEKAGTLKANAYWSGDNFGFNVDTTFNYSNFNASLRWELPQIGNTNGLVSATFDTYSNDLQDLGSSAYEYTLHTAIKQAALKASFKTEIENHLVSYGAEVIRYDMNPGEINPASDTSYVAAKRLSNECAVQPSIWIGDTWSVNDQISVEYGARTAFFINGKQFKAFPEGRLSAKYTVNPDLSIKAGFGNNTQFIHLISNTSSISPMDTWKLSDSRIRPQTGWQAATGAYYTGLGGKVEFSLEAYYKRMYRYLDYKSGATLVMNENLADDLVETTGKAYGVELMAKKPSGKLTGWIAYTYSRTFLKEMQDRGLETINKGNWYSAAFDKPHDLKVVSNYAFTHRYSLSVNLDYSTGRPVTIPVGKYYYANAYRFAYSERNAYRVPDYFRMDLAFNIDPGHKLRKLLHYTFTFGVYNVTGRHNAYSIYYRTDNLKTSGYMLSVFAVPIPYASINMKF